MSSRQNSKYYKISYNEILNEKVKTTTTPLEILMLCSLQKIEYCYSPYCDFSCNTLWIDVLFAYLLSLYAYKEKEYQHKHTRKNRHSILHIYIFSEYDLLLFDAIFYQYQLNHTITDHRIFLFVCFCCCCANFLLFLLLTYVI